MVLSNKMRLREIAATGLLSAFLLPGLHAVAQDDIEEPAGDIAEAMDDSESESAADAGTDIPMDDAGQVDARPEPASGRQTAPDDEYQNESGENESGRQIGPVWESYNDSLKSVAQEVTKGLRVEDVVEPPTEYHYAAFGKPDPFVPPMIARKDQEVASISGLEVPIVSPLQRYDVSELRLVGIWQLSTGERKALIMSPAEGDASGPGIIVRNGDSVGKRAGKVLAIGDTFLTVREFKLALDGTRQYEDIQMLMGTRDPNAVPGKLKFTPGAETTQVILEGQRTTPVPGGAAGAGAPGGGNQFAPGTAAPQTRDTGLRATAPEPAPVGQAGNLQPQPIGGPTQPAAVQPAVAPPPAPVPGMAPVAGQMDPTLTPNPNQPAP